MFLMVKSCAWKRHVVGTEEDDDEDEAEIFSNRATQAVVNFAFSEKMAPAMSISCKGNTCKPSTEAGRLLKGARLS